MREQLWTLVAVVVGAVAAAVGQVISDARRRRAESSAQVDATRLETCRIILRSVEKIALSAVKPGLGDMLMYLGRGHLVFGDLAVSRQGMADLRDAVFILERVGPEPLVRRAQALLSATVGLVQADTHQEAQACFARVTAERYQFLAAAADALGSHLRPSERAAQRRPGADKPVVGYAQVDPDHVQRMIARSRTRSTLSVGTLVLATLFYGRSFFKRVIRI